MVTMTRTRVLYTLLFCIGMCTFMVWVMAPSKSEANSFIAPSYPVKPDDVIDFNDKQEEQEEHVKSENDQQQEISNNKPSEVQQQEPENSKPQAAPENSQQAEVPNNTQQYVSDNTQQQEVSDNTQQQAVSDNTQVSENTQQEEGPISSLLEISTESTYQEISLNAPVVGKRDSINKYYQYCSHRGSEPKQKGTPEHFFFTKTDDNPFTMVEILSVASVRVYHPQANITLYVWKDAFQYVASGCWWDAYKKLVTEIILIDIPTRIGGKQLVQPGNRADFVKAKVVWYESYS